LYKSRVLQTYSAYCIWVYGEVHRDSVLTSSISQYMTIMTHEADTASLNKVRT